MKPTIEFKFKFDRSDDFKSWPRFCSTEYHAISAKMHRVLPARSKKVEFESRFAPIFLYERRASRRSKRGYVNVNVRYYAIDERGQVKTFRTWRKFLKELERELERNLVKNPLTKMVYRFSQYDEMEVTLYRRFFADEKGEIERCIEEFVSSQLNGLRDSLRAVTGKISLLETKLSWLEETKQDLERFRVCPTYDALANILSNYSATYFSKDQPDKQPSSLYRCCRQLRSVFEVMKKLQKTIESEKAEFEKQFENKQEIKEKFKGLLADLKKLSASKREIVHAILTVTNPEYRMAMLQMEEMLKVTHSMFEKHYDEFVERVEREMSMVREEISKLREKEERLRRRIEAERERLTETARREIEKSIIPN